MMATIIQVSFAEELEFSLVPPKSIPAGQTADLVLPVRVLDESCLFDISTEVSPNYPIQHINLLEGRTNQITYLTFSVQIPANAPSGKVVQVLVNFTPKEGCTSEQVYQKVMNIRVESFERVDFNQADERVELNSRVGRIGLNLRNSGNTNLDLDLQVENYTPNVKISFSKNSLSLAPGSSGEVSIIVDFSASGADFASFKVVALSQGRRFLSKVYDVRMINRDQTNNSQRSLNSQILLTSEFFSEGSAARHREQFSFSSSGELSDFYALSTSLQTSLLEGREETSQIEIDLDKYDQFRVTLGSSLNPTDASIVGAEQIEGIRLTKNMFKDLKVGFYGGEDFDDHQHLGSFIDWNRGYQSRYIIFIDRNMETKKNNSGFSGQEYIRVNDTLAFSPSITIAEDEYRGTFSQVGVALNSILFKKAPLQLTHITEQDSRYQLSRIASRISIPFKNLNFTLGGELENLDAKTDELRFADGEYQEAFFQVLFPLMRSVDGQFTLKYQKTPEGDNGIVPELFLSFSQKRWQGFVRAGQLLSRGAQEIVSVNNQLNYSLNKESFIQGNLKYYFNDFVSVYFRGEYFDELDSDYQRESLSLGVQRDFNDKKTSFRLGVSRREEENFYQRGKTYSLDGLFSHKISPQWSVQTSFSVDDYQEIEHTDYQFYTQLSYTPLIPVAKRVENFFGGKSTGSIQGRICLDLSLDGLCSEGDKFFKNVEIRLAGLTKISNEEGSFLFENIEPGAYELILNRDTLPGEGVIKEHIISTRVSANMNQQQDFVLSWNGILNVIVFEDQNEDGIWQDEIEKQLPNIEIRLKGEAQDLIKSSYSDRAVTFDQLKAGEYTLSLFDLPLFARASHPEVVVRLPRRENFISLGVIFEENQDDNFDNIIGTLEDNLVFSDNPQASIEFSDPNKKMISYNYTCGNFTSQKFSNLPKETSFKQTLSLTKCLENQTGNDAASLFVHVYDLNGLKIKTLEFEVIFI